MLNMSDLLGEHVEELAGRIGTRYVGSPGNRAAGDYTASWDGKNRGGRAVSRGMYFIRVVGPEIDEIRKVMIVK